MCIQMTKRAPVKKRVDEGVCKLGQRTRGRSEAPGDGDGRGAAEGGGSGADGRGCPPRRAEARTGARCVAEAALPRRARPQRVSVRTFGLKRGIRVFCFVSFFAVSKLYLVR